MENITLDKLRFGILGFGKIARTKFLPAILRVPSVHLTAIGTRHPSQLDTSSLSVSQPLRVLQYQEMIAEGRNLVDAVYIALPNDMHEEWILHCAEAGLHILCEKPLVAQSAAALRCRQMCQEHKVLLAEAFMYRHHPRHQRVRNLIQSGPLGQVHLIEASFSYFLEDLTNIRLRADRQGGALMDIGCYGIDVARLLLGEEPIAVAALCVQGARSRVDELVTVTMLFPSNSMAVVTASTHLARYHAYRVRGTQGCVTVPNAFVPNEGDPTRILIESASGEQQVEEFPPFATFDTEIAHFASAALASDPTLLPPAEDGAANARVLEEAIRSMGEGSKVDFMGETV